MKKDIVIKLLNTPSKDGGMRNLTEKSIISKFPDLYEFLIGLGFPKDFTIKQMIYHYINDDVECNIGICECGKRCNFLSINEGYCKHCSVKCSRNSKDVNEKKKTTCLKKYGVDSPSKSDTVKEKRKQTFINKFGVEHPMLLDEIKEKIKNTNIERYGVECVFQSDEIKEKIKETNTEKYGCENPMQSDEVKEKIKKTNMEKYGVTYPLQSDEIKEKMKETNMERYGVENVGQIDEVREKAKKTNMEKYGVECHFQSDEIKEKIKETNMERYGVKNVFQSDEIKEKIKETNMKRYGVEKPAQCDSVKSKTIQTTVERYGVKYPMQSDSIKEKAMETNTKRYGVKYITQSDKIKEKIKNTNLEKYGVEWFCQTSAERNYSNDSKPNLSFAARLDECNIVYDREYPISNYSYDFIVGNYLVEINPTITHNSHISIFNGKVKNSSYHSDKSQTALNKGYFCIHVWDWDDQDKIVNMLKPKNVVYARNLEIRDVSVESASLFLNTYHLQNTCRGQSVIYGLYMDDILVELMSFGNPRYNGNYEWELLRLCTHKDYTVVGGAERLFKHFILTNKPKSIISYCDNSKFSGHIYEKLGFKILRSSKPTCHWYNLKTKQHITDNLLRQRGFDQLFGTNYGKGTSNKELMLEYGFLPVYDCGQTSFVWNVQI